MNSRTYKKTIAGVMLIVSVGTACAQALQNTTTSYQYDANGNLTRISDPLGHITNTTYDALNRRTSITDPAAGVTRFGYDGRDQLSQVTDPRSLVTTYVNDGLGNQTQQQSPDTGVTSRTFDAAGNVLTQTDAKGQATSYQYDVLNRIVQITYAVGSFVTYAYDQGVNGIGRLTTITDAGGTLAYTYDYRGRILTDVRTRGVLPPTTTSYRYDSAGRLAGLTYPSGRTVDYTRDGVGRISQVSTTQNGVTQEVISGVTYQPFGGVQAVVFGNGQIYQRGIDTDGRIASYTLNAQPSNLSYDAASRITALADAATPANSATIGYDALDRLTSFQQTGVSRTYAYDAVGNRSSQVNGAATTTYTYGTTSNRLAQVTGAQTTTLATDLNGSITSNGASTFSYDARGRMVSATSAIGVVQYQINGLGQRVQKTTPTETTVFHYDMEGRLIGERTGTAQKDYVFLGDMPVAVLK